MRWRRLPRPRGQVEDRRGRSRGGGGLPLPTGKMGGGIGGVIVLVIVLAVAFLGGANPLGSDSSGFDGFGLEPFPQVSEPGSPEPALQDGADGGRAFVTAIAGDLDALWRREFTRSGQPYASATVVLFRRAVRSGCGPASAATGPFYCTLDERIYIDLGFYDQLSRRFGAPGDFAQAYVLAHEFGHHVQNRLGIHRRVTELSRAEPADRNALSVRLELQADCFAGVWGHSAGQRDLLDPGDIEEGLRAAEAIGDDRIQARARGRVDPETWTHGSSEQRRTWFQRGLESGDPNACDTFSGGV